MDESKPGNVSQPPAILDYAAPRARGKLRLANRSVLKWEQVDGRFELIETLSGKSKAVGAFLLTGIALAASVVALGAIRPVGPPVLMVFFGFWAGVLVLVLMIVESTWRTTSLRAGADGLSLRFRSPLQINLHEYSREEIAEVSVWPTVPDSDSGPLGELVVRPANAPAIKLFTDHPEPEVTAVRDAVLAALEGRNMAPARVDPELG